MSFFKNKIIFIIVSILFAIFLYYFSPRIYALFSNNIQYNIEDVAPRGNDTSLLNNTDTKIDDTIEKKESTLPVIHIKTPEGVRAIYMSGWVAGTVDFRNSLIKMIDTTELNSVVIDIKDSTGRISYKTDDISIEDIGSSENRIKNIRELTDLLHSKGIYIIGRISVFQDPYLTKLKPEWAIKKQSDGGIWKDRKGLSFLDPTNKKVHDYILSIAKNAYKEGFDEINFDYIRYPSDGNMKDINYNLKDGKTRADNIEDFFKYISTELKKDENIPISADLFGLTTEATDDMGIGQVWEKAIQYFDFVCPMIYPSHYPSGHMNYKNPANFPYEVITQALKSAIIKTINIKEDIKKIRPWLQDFDMGTTYTKELVRAQMKAVQDLDLDGWMLWDPSNKYTPTALLPEKSN